MPLPWKRNLPPARSPEQATRSHTEKIAYELSQTRQLLKRPGDQTTDWETAEKIVKSPVRKALYRCHRPFIRLEKNTWEPLLAWANNQALLSLLGLVGNIGLIIAVATYIGSEKQRRDAEVRNAWQTITSAHGQTGSGGRIRELEFLNASPGANWRRKFPWVCAPSLFCLWEAESLDGIDLSVEYEGNAERESSEETSVNRPGSGAYLRAVQLPKASLRSANLKMADLEDANLAGAALWIANLAGAALHNANLKGADLRSANLERADLADANLERALLESANLKGAALWSANLAWTFLANANLEGASLDNANLKGAFLREADLAEASLAFTNLEGAVLREANLEGADLNSANLAEADLEDANLKGADLPNANLTGARNLTTEQLAQAELLCLTILPKGIELSMNRDCDKLFTSP